MLHGKLTLSGGEGHHDGGAVTSTGYQFAVGVWELTLSFGEVVKTGVQHWKLYVSSLWMPGN